VPGGAVGLALRNLAVSALGLPFLGKQVVARALNDEVWVPHYGTLDRLWPLATPVDDQPGRSARVSGM
jgi:hypothetical protein